jgi:anaerobic dimethyl sulfoxide reductase subunit A
MSRRAFVGASAAAALTLAAGCTPENKLGETGAGERKVYRLDPELDESVDGKWITASCVNNCGGMCLNKAWVVDSTVIRTKSDDVSEDSWNTPQLRACPRGRAKRQATFGADRIKYPMRRKNWEPLTGGRKELRGIDEWERISWDDALQYVADEINHAIDNYGNRSILLPSNYNNLARVFDTLGGFTTSSSTMSWGSACMNAHTMGLTYIGLGEENDRMDYVNADYLVIYGGNPAWASPGTYTYFFTQAKQVGVQFVFVGPEYNATAAVFDAKWIQVRPGTDTAFLLAVAYEMFTADEKASGSVIDWDFLEKYTVGIDGDHMPSDAKIDENFKDYVMGAYDNTPKTAEWASKISGTSVEDIKWYAEMMNRNNAVTCLRSYAAARCNDSDHFIPIWSTIGFMGGHMGKPGHSTGTAYHNCIGSVIDPIFVPGTSGLPPIAPILDDNLTDVDIWNGILTGSFNQVGNVLAGVLSPGDVRSIDIHVIGHIDTAAVQTRLDVNKAIEAHRKVDFVFCTASALTSQALYSDIVLPVCTEWEFAGTTKGGALPSLVNREVFIVATAVCEPLYESRRPQDIYYDLAEKLGLDAKAIFPISETQQWFNTIKGTQVKKLDNSGLENLVSITQADIDNLGIESELQEGRVAFSKLIEDGIYKMERSPGDAFTYIGYDKFFSDPEGNPRNTPSGKFEIYCQTRADTLNATGFSKDYTWKPYPSYKVPLNGYEQTFSDFEAGAKGEYPYQVFNPHYLRRSHTQFDNLPWLRQAWPQPIWISSQDALEKDIQNGDTVRVWSRAGQIIRHASITNRLMPGVIALVHGAWPEIDSQTGIDKAGNENILCESVTTGSGVSGYNTNIANFEKYDEMTLDEDCLWPQRIIEFA